ncbi:MAG: LysE family transporter [Nitrososphaera sp.]|uniref:LysE family transporter n=1 Tax=Nitrososphaera sp. TaxID=1971748 RepID=UPI00316CCB6A
MTSKAGATMQVDALSFGAEVVAVSASGVLAPGPLFVANMLCGSRQGAMSGVKVAHGHAVVEIAVIAAIAAGLFSAPAFVEQYSAPIAIVGGVAVLGFAALQVHSVLKQRIQEQATQKRTPFAVGVALTALNPFFLVWWLTAGLKLVADSSSFGPVAGVGLLFGLHVWMDYAWLGATAYLASKGSSVLGSKYYKIMMLALAGVLAYYGAQFLAGGLRP